MKFSLAFIALISVSAINANTTEEPDQFEHDIIDYSVNRIKSIEENIPDWDASASLEKNALTIVNKAFKSGTIPFWNPGAALKVNLVYALEAYLRSLKIRDFDETKTFEENINFAIVDFLRSLPMLPSWFPIGFIQKQMVDNVLDAFENINVPGFDVNKSVDDNVVALVAASISNIGPSTTVEEDVITSVKMALSKLILPGFNPAMNLEENVAGVIKDLLLRK